MKKRESFFIWSFVDSKKSLLVPRIHFVISKSFKWKDLLFVLAYEEKFEELDSLMKYSSLKCIYVIFIS